MTVQRTSLNLVHPFLTEWPLVLVVSSVVLLVACGEREPGPRPESSPVSTAPSGQAVLVQAELAEVQVTQAQDQMEVTGKVASRIDATLASKVQGLIQDIRGREGTPVKAGDTLVLLDNRDLKANVSRAEAEVDHARGNLIRMKSLFTEEAVSRQEMEDADRTFRVAEAGRQAAAAQLSYTLIKAPFDGVITEKLVEIGELASPGQPLLKVEDDRQLRLEATVAEGDLKVLSRGDTVPVVIDALGPAPLSGTIAQILPSGDSGTHTFQVKIDLPPTAGLKTGMFGRMQFDKGSVSTMVVPRTALVERGQLMGVYVVERDQVARLRWIKSGRAFGDRLEVLSGLNVGEHVLRDGAKGIDGARVERRDAGAGTPPR